MGTDNNTVPSHIAKLADESCRSNQGLERAPFLKLQQACLAAAKTGDPATFLCEFGGALERQADYQAYLKSNTWYQKRQVAVNQAGHRCQRCDAANIRLEVHHVRYPQVWGEEPLENLRVLCPACHYQMHEELDEG